MSDKQIKISHDLEGVRRSSIANLKVHHIEKIRNDNFIIKFIMFFPHPSNIIHFHDLIQISNL